MIRLQFYFPGWFSGQTEESLGEGQEMVRFICDKRLNGSGAVTASEQVFFAEVVAHVAGTRFGRIHQRNFRPGHLPDCPLEQRIVGAAKDEGIDAAAKEWSEVFLEDGLRDLMVDPAFLYEGHEQRAGLGENFCGIGPCYEPI